jgi:hypothetical protein
MAKIDIDVLAGNIFVLILIAISVISVVMIRDYSGFALYDAARGGRITEVNVYQSTPAYSWNGVYGIIIQAPGVNTTWYVFANPAGMSEINPIVTCLEPGKVHEVYVTTLNATQIVWEEITAAPLEMVDDFINYTGISPMNLSLTFYDTMDIMIGNTTVQDVPIAYMKQYDVPGSEEFPMGLLQYDGTLIFVAIVNTDYLMGYRPDKIFNFELMVAVPKNTTNLRYNLYTDPYDQCEQGGGGPQETLEKGSIHGWVTENESGQFLENAIVSINNDIYITGQDGYYNFTDLPALDFYIVALKTGLANYVDNITIIDEVDLEYNISMKIVFDETLTGTGPGIGTGVGPGISFKTKTDDGPGIGPGVGPGIGPYLEKPEQFGIDHWMSLDMLRKRMRLETFFTEHLLIFSFRKETVKVDVKATGDVAEFLELSDSSVTIEPGGYANVTIKGYALREGIFTGSIDISGDFNGTLPVELTISDEERLPVEALLVELNPLTQRPLPGKNFKFSVGLQNLLIAEEYDVYLSYFIRGVDADTANYSASIGNDTVAIRTSETIIKEFTLPSEWPKGEYYLVVEAYYFDQYSRTSTIFEVFEPIQNYKVLGVVELWKIFAALLSVGTLLGIFLYIRHDIDKKKRFHAKVEYKLLPQKGPRSLYMGKIAETENDTYFDMDKLTVHSIIAGSTGGGKSISAQVIVEEALLKGVAVVVVDPTAQWTGMLRKCADEKMMSFYPRFKMTKNDARAFNGNIRAIVNPREKIDLGKYWKPGEIQVITTSTLDPKGMDIFVANTVREVFHSNLQEYRGLRYMMVYDEVHRLLPKFGGSGEGFIQIERACREFRKWGIGVMLVSQVLADFVGQIKANINTEIQMKTRDEGDLSRIETKYGKSYIQELVKSPVGSGMVQNSDWNRGKPYYITFRPIMHSVIRLTDQELEQYNKYNNIVDDLSFQLDQLEQMGKDVFDLRLELKLSLDKIKQGGFNMVEIYLEGLTPRIEKLWKDLGKTPKKREVELVSETELSAEISAAKKESDKIKDAAAATAGGGEGEKKKALGLNDDVPPDKMLKLVNGTLVVKLKALLDEVNVLKDAEFKEHVNPEKNDFSFWIRDAVGNDKWADMADQIIAKEDYVKFLEALDAGKEKDFKVTTPREKPFSSKKEAAKEAVADKKEAGAADQKKDEKPASPEQKTAASAAPAQKIVSAVSSATAKPSAATASSNSQTAKPAAAAINAQKPAATPSSAAAKPSPAATKSPASSPNAAVIKAGATAANPQQMASGQAKPLLDVNAFKAKISALQPQAKLDALKAALVSYPGNRDLIFMIASEFHRQGKLADAESYYKKLGDTHANALYYLGSIYLSQKKYDDAAAAFNKVLKLQPAYPKVKEYLTSIQKLKGVAKV